MKTIKYYLIGFTDRETPKSFFDLVKEKLGKGVNHWCASESLETMKDEIIQMLEEGNE